MYQPQLFDFKGQQVRTVTINNEPYFVAPDVTKILGLSNTSVALSRLDDDERSKFNLGRQGETNVVNEYGLYELIIASRKPQAHEFKRWITHEVLPAIRKTGAYQAKPKDNYPIPATYGEALQLAATLQTKIEHDAPSLKYFHDQMRNPGLMTTTEIAKDYGWSARKLNKYLESKGVIYRQGNKWVIYQKYADKGYSQYEPFPYDNNKGVKNNLKWTQRGRKFIYDVLNSHGILPVLEQSELLPETGTIN